ncbi:flagellar brake protein [Nitrosomonas sp.]|uniref:flagellar brake protein n=1 Tax=Nitrosomonas sp. TaxID=42353 RepID=UPI0025E9282A|nr:flagellar brake protein [Nitrosomonas sp.]
MIVSMPASDQLIGEPFIEGDQIHVRLITGQYAYKFTVFVDKIIKVPFKYLYLSFPKDIQGQSIRKSRRIKCNLQATVAEKAIPITISDLSICGAGITSHLPLGTHWD